MNDGDLESQVDSSPISKKLARFYGALFVVFAILWAFQVAGEVGIALFREQFLVGCLGLAGGAVFLTCRFSREKNFDVPWYDWLFSTLFVFVTFYIAIGYGRVHH